MSKLLQDWPSNPVYQRERLNELYSALEVAALNLSDCQLLLNSAGIKLQKNQPMDARVDMLACREVLRLIGERLIDC